MVNINCFWVLIFISTSGSTDVHAISNFITRMTLFRLKMLKRLLKKNWKAQESCWGIEAGRNDLEIVPIVSIICSLNEY